VANVTIALDDDLVRRVRVRAAENGTSLNAVIRRHLEGYAGDDKMDALTRLLTRDYGSPVDREPYVWNREEIYRERLDEISPR
jgi:plasmid stability protein